ncbi:chromate efflux transporter [Lysinibacillus sp. 54212]|uniref:chromate efflux transporter n=1 Tax=Lysinibacillus sp. 54212 TaxID=3119829 RepID=UPI002FCBABCC
MRNYWEIFIVSLKLGLTSFGGPTAHLAYFQKEYVDHRQWLNHKEYAELVVLSQFLPGPASSQVGMGIGFIRGGWFGSFCSFLGFTFPSVFLLMLFATILQNTALAMDWLDGLKLVAVAIVAHAIVDMAKKILVTKRHWGIAIGSLAILLLWTGILSQVIVLAVAILCGLFFLKPGQFEQSKERALPSLKTGLLLLFAFFVGLIGLPALLGIFPNDWLQMVSSLYVSGSLVFGGGHVVLPLLETQFVQAGIISADEFLAGYGFTQAVPGPLFTFASYLGTTLFGFFGGLVATIAIFLPAFLILFGVWPIWYKLKGNSTVRKGMAGLNAAVVGILAAAWVNPIVTTSIHNGMDIIVAIIFYALLAKAKLQPLWIVGLGVIVGILL